MMSSQVLRVILGAMLLSLLLSGASCEPGPGAYSAPSSKIAFTSDRDGNREIHVMNADGSGQTAP